MVDAQEAVIGIAETIQTAHLERAPNAKLDNAPETSFDTKQTVHFEADSSEDVDSNVDGDEVPLSLLRPAPRRPQMPPLPDLRFEQSYLHSIKHAEGWHGIAYITVRDQVYHPSRVAAPSSADTRMIRFSCLSFKG